MNDMDKVYRIAGQYVDVSHLRYLGPLVSPASGLAVCQIFFSDQPAEKDGRPLYVNMSFRSGADGLPKYHNTKGDWTDPDSDFFRAAQAEVDMLIAYWNKYRAE